MLDHDKLKNLPDGELRAFLKELEADVDFIKKTLGSRKKIYYCTVCQNNPVDADNGFDTCQDCNP
jgi:hypothetical protein